MNQSWCNFKHVSKITIQPGSVHAWVSLSVFPKARAVRAHQPPQNSVPLCASCFPLWLFLSHERKSQVHLPQQISGSPLGRAPRRISISGTHGMCAGDSPAWAEPHTALVQSWSRWHVSASPAESETFPRPNVRFQDVNG